MHPNQPTKLIASAAIGSLFLAGITTVIINTTSHHTNLPTFNTSINQPAAQPTSSKPQVLGSSTTTTPKTISAPSRTTTTTTPLHSTSATHPSNPPISNPGNSTSNSPLASSNSSTSSTPPSSTSTNTTVTTHVGGYPPAVSATLTPDFENPIIVVGNVYPQYPNPYVNTSTPLNSNYEVATKYCIYTYADSHTVKKDYQYLAYAPRYANPDGSLNPSGINMAVTSNPTYGCDIASAPKSVFEGNYTY